MLNGTLAPQVATIALAIGLLFALACYLTTNLSPGGMITPGWLALTLTEDVARSRSSSASPPWPTSAPESCSAP